jgi:2-polyprenyl-3-methyl-5-hydroxy-6-metoxy-1,4-benzoquinol methylase
VSATDGIHFVVQASSTSWSGSRDFCMGEIDGVPAVRATIETALGLLPGADVVVAAPSFDREGELPDALAGLLGPRVRLFFGFDESPLDRLIAVTAELGDDDHVLRVDGLHFGADWELAERMLATARAERLDCVKPPDDFPPQLATDVYRVGALRRARERLRDAPGFEIHPKFFMLDSDEFTGRRIDDVPQYDEAVLRRYRDAMSRVMQLPRTEVTSGSVRAGDQLSFHYEHALAHIEPGMRVLDVACGAGFGARMVAGRGAEVHGVDLDKEAIARARAQGGATETYHVADCTQLPFEDAAFDAVLTFETVEHVPAAAFLEELRRVTRSGAVIVASTPQNSMGSIPINAHHNHEYSLEEVRDLFGRYFEIERVVGIKAGTITSEADPVGTNTILVCQRA